MKVLHIIGADLSKKTIDFATPEAAHIKVSNDSVGYHQFMGWLKKQRIDSSKMMIVMEHTGLYSYRLEQFLHKHHFSFTKVSAYAIKRSMGIIRGKNDKVDAIRIARYGFEKQDRLACDGPVDTVLERLKILYATRDRLVRNRAGMLGAVKEIKACCGLRKDDLIITSQLQVIKTVGLQIARLDKEITDVIESEKALKQNAELLQSIPAVGKVVAVATIIKTRNFTKFSDSRKFACHSGTAPFENTSGTSIRGKTRVSKLADQDMKRLLDLSAKSAIQYDKELKQYYQRRIAEGKSKMSTINIVRNKILHRMFAVIKRQTPFVKDYLQTA
jgi:transposase